MISSGHNEQNRFINKSYLFEDKIVIKSIRRQKTEPKNYIVENINKKLLKHQILSRILSLTILFYLFYFIQYVTLFLVQYVVKTK
jgi:hypothetical protein